MRRRTAQSIAPLAAAILAASGATATPPPFIPAAASESRSVAALRIVPGGNMPLVDAVLDGTHCVLLFDTGATHTTFDAAFAKRSFPDAKFEPVLLAGETNVEGAPELFRAKELKIGEASFRDFDAMALDLSNVSGDIGAKIDGVLGMNVIGRLPALVSLGSRQVVFNPTDADRAGFGPPARRDPADPLSLAFRLERFGRLEGLEGLESSSPSSLVGRVARMLAHPTGFASRNLPYDSLRSSAAHLNAPQSEKFSPSGRARCPQRAAPTPNPQPPIPLIIDSASSFTFLSLSSGWPSTKTPVALGTIDVNGKGGISAERGEPGVLPLGGGIAITPLLVAEPLNRIGVDALLSTDLLIDFSRVHFRPR